MAVDYAPLNRNQEFTTPQKAALKKVFGFAETAATGASTVVSRKKVHLALSGHFPENDKRSLQVLFAEIRSAIDATDNARSIDSLMGGGFSMEGAKRLVIKTMADAAIAQIT